MVKGMAKGKGDVTGIECSKVVKRGRIIEFSVIAHLDGWMVPKINKVHKLLYQLCM